MVGDNRIRKITVQEFVETCEDLLVHANVGEPLDKEACKDTYDVLAQFYKSTITIQEFASFLRQFHLRPMPEVLLPPVDTFTKVYEADDGREHTALKAESTGFLQVHYSQSASCYHLGFTTVGLPPSRRVFVDRVIYGSWAYHEKILPGMEIIKVDKKDVYNMSLTQYVNALKHARPLSIKFAVYSNIIKRFVPPAKSEPGTVEEDAERIRKQLENCIVFDCFAIETDGDLGFTLKKSGETVSEGPDGIEFFKKFVIHEVSHWARDQGLQPGDEIIRLNKRDFMHEEILLFREQWRAILSHRPLRFKIRRPINEFYERVEGISIDDLMVSAEEYLFVKFEYTITSLRRGDLTLTAAKMKEKSGGATRKTAGDAMKYGKGDI